MKILILDDEKKASNVITTMVKAAAPTAEVETFNSPLEALKFAETWLPDVAFLDIQMPEMTGLQVAMALKKINPQVNVIFSTGFSEYATDAFNIHASGYIMKPVRSAAVKEELENLRNIVPIQESPDSRCFIRTFGNFDVFVDGQLIQFRRQLAKELLAYLVDRKGGTATRKEIAAALFQDDNYSRASQAYMTQIISKLKEALKGAGIEDILIVDYNSFAVDPSRFTCDAYEYLKGDPKYINAFKGEYMNQYEWAEYSKEQFYNG